MAGGKLKDCKERGEWAELYFMMMAAGLAMKVSKPFGDSGRYDVGVESRGQSIHGRVLRVQVKSCTHRRGRGYWCQFRPHDGKNEDYSLEQVDLFAAYVISTSIFSEYHSGYST